MSVLTFLSKKKTFQVVFISTAAVCAIFKLQMFQINNKTEIIANVSIILN